MNRGFIAVLVLATTFGATLPASAQAPRKDYIWARSTSATITMDGVLNEPAWAQADSVVIHMAQDTGIPGSGWFYEQGVAPSDPTYATIRFLRQGNQLWMGAYIRDKSIGGSGDFLRSDGLLMAIKDHLSPSRPAPPAEYFYTWWSPENPVAASAPGAVIGFRGRWTGGCNDPTPDCTRPRTAQEIAAWDARTGVGGTTNTDAVDDWGYVVEMRFDVGPTVMGYDFTKPGGDVVEWNISIYDTDWNWPNTASFSSNRVWWEGPWGRDAYFHNVRILGRSDVTTTSGAAPALGPDIRIPDAGSLAAPTMDGLLTDAVWQKAPHFDIRYNDTALRNTYPGQGPWRSGQVQFAVNQQPLPTVLDPGDCTVSYFFKGDKLYLGFDVRDQIVQYYSPAVPTRWDGAIVSINNYSLRSADNNQLVGYKLSWEVGPTAAASPQDELPALISQGGAQVVLHLKNPSSPVCDCPADTTDRATSDIGYTAEMWIDLTKIGYPTGRGDGRIFLGIDLLDGDSFTNWPDSYGTRVWWQREFAGGSGAGGGGPDGPAWGYLDPTILVGVGDPDPAPQSPLALLGASPNPYRSRTAVHFSLARPSDVKLEVYDMQGRMVAARDYGRQPAGPSHVIFGDDRMASGLYMYRLRVADGVDRSTTTLAGKMLLVR